MIVIKEFIWYEDHFVLHITKEEKMIRIMEKGLLPLNGERCSQIGDEWKGVFCLDALSSVEDWATELYERHELETLKLLRFNLKRRKWYIDNSNDLAFGMYLPYKVLPEKISYLDIKDEKGRSLPLTKLFDLDLLYLYEMNKTFIGIENNQDIFVDNYIMSWQPISQYKNKIKTL